jgi:hypothetical protein
MLTKLLHMHVPKTAGTSVNSWLEDAVSFEKAKPDRFDGLLDHWFRENGIVSQRSIHANCLVCWDLFDVLHGHRNFLPERPANAIVLTVLRDPVQRAISQHHDMASLKEHDFRHMTNPNTLEFHRDCITMSFTELRGKWSTRETTFTGHYVDYMCRIFLSRDHRLKEFMSLAPKKRFEGAFGIITASGMTVGITEQMEKSVHLFSKLIGVYPARNLPKYNVGRSVGRPMTTDDIAYLRSITAGDQMLYDHFRKEFDAIEVAYSVADFERDRLPDAMRRVEVAEAKGFKVYGMNAALIGEGFWRRDGAGRPECCRWSGPGDDATIYIPAYASGEVVVEAFVVGWMSAAARASFAVRAWDQPVKHRFALMHSRSFADVAIFRAAPRDGVLKIQFHCDAKTDEECGHRRSDGRRKGFALREVRMKPA